MELELAPETFAEVAFDNFSFVRIKVFRFRAMRCMWIEFLAGRERAISPVKEASVTEEEEEDKAPVAVPVEEEVVGTPASEIP